MVVILLFFKCNNSFKETFNDIGGVDQGNSNSSWRQTMQPILVGVHRLYPLSIEMEQRLILHYLGPTSEYQDVGCLFI